MRIKTARTKNGAKIVGVNVPGAESITLNFGFKVGSRLEKKEYSGLSHFLEHMMFKGSAKYPSNEMISKTLDSIGAIHNAETDKEYTEYYVRTAPENFDLALDVVSDMVLEPLLEQGELAKERGTIIEELNLYESNPLSNIGSKMERALFGENSTGFDVIGNINSIKKINAKIMREYYEEFYNGSNLSVTVTGKLPKDYEKKIVKIVSKVPVGNASRFVKAKYSNEKILLMSKQSEQTALGLSLPSPSIFDEQRYAAKILSVILGGYMSSRLFVEVREKRGWAYQIAAFSSAFTDAGMFGIMGGIRNDKVYECLSLIRGQVLVMPDTISDEEIERAKGYLSGALKIAFENPETLAGYVTLRTILKGIPESPFDEIEKLQKVTKKEIIDVAEEIFAPQNLHLAVIGPFKSSEKFARILG